jgi:hypothetical protein
LRADRDRIKCELSELRADCAREVYQLCAAHESAKAEAASQATLNAEAATLSLVAATSQAVVQSMSYTRAKFEECLSIALRRGPGLAPMHVPLALVERELEQVLESLIDDVDSATPQNGLLCAVPIPRSYFDPRASPERCGLDLRPYSSRLAESATKLAANLRLDAGHCLNNASLPPSPPPPADDAPWTPVVPQTYATDQHPAVQAMLTRCTTLPMCANALVASSAVSYLEVFVTTPRPTIGPLSRTENGR